MAPDVDGGMAASNVGGGGVAAMNVAASISSGVLAGGVGVTSGGGLAGGVTSGGHGGVDVLSSLCLVGGDPVRSMTSFRSCKM